MKRRHRLIFGRTTDSNKKIIYISSCIYDDEFKLNYNNIQDLSDNRIILSGLVELEGKTVSTIGITESNLFNNIKLMFSDDNIDNPRLIFKKYDNRVPDSNIKYKDYLLKYSDISDLVTELGMGKFDITIDDGRSNNLDYNFNIDLVVENSYKYTNYYKIDLSNYSILNGNNGNNKINSINSIKLDNNIDNGISFNNLYDISNNLLVKKNFNNNLYDNNLYFYTKKNIENVFDICNNNTNYNINFSVINTKSKKNKIYFIKQIDNLFNSYSKTLIKINGYAINKNNNKLINNINDLSKNIVLSLGNGITGITQKSIGKIINIRESNKSKIIFKNSTNHSTNNNYLIDNSYNYNYAHSFYYRYNTSISKVDTIDLKNIIDTDTSFNYSLVQDISFTYVNFNLLGFKNFYNNINFYIPNIIDNRTKKNRTEYKIISKLSLNIDYKFNYDKSFKDSQYMYLRDNSDNIYSINTINIYNKFKTDTAREYTNVNCIYTWFDPENEFTPSDYRYPNNNILITTDSEIDTFSKAIEVLPSRRTANTNSVFIPDRNSSNLSRKHIQGLIGLNNVPRLLSIEPKNNDEFIIGRGSTNVDIPLTYREKIDRKIESTKYKQDKINRNNLPKLLSSRARLKNALNRTSSGKNINISMLNTQECDICYNMPVVTPFTMFKTNRGKYM
tara:strand:+ start:3158 stop:5179 length:2022 start_codon:yes stop_codon:yes gene_type:complete